MITVKKGVYFSWRLKNLFILILPLYLVATFIFVSILGVLKNNDESIGVIAPDVNLTPLIIIDPGHGGEDGGTSSSKGTLEKDINLDISQKLALLMNLVGYRTLMTRTEDKLIYSGTPLSMREKKVSDIKNRMEIMNANPSAVFLSIHQNYFSESKYWGTQVFYSGNDPQSKLIADELQHTVASNLQKDNTRKIKQSGKEIYLLYHATTPAVMVECGFMSNPSEALLLCDNAYQMKMALTLIGGINNYFETKGEK